MCNRKKEKKNIASAGNRTRAARVAGEHSTTEPPMLLRYCLLIVSFAECSVLHILLFSILLLYLFCLVYIRFYTDLLLIR